MCGFISVRWSAILVSIVFSNSVNSCSNLTTCFQVSFVMVDYLTWEIGETFGAFATRTNGNLVWPASQSDCTPLLAPLQFAYLRWVPLKENSYEIIWVFSKRQTERTPGQSVHQHRCSKSLMPQERVNCYTPVFTYSTGILKLIWSVA